MHRQSWPFIFVWVLLVGFIGVAGWSCAPRITWPRATAGYTGTAFFQDACAMGWRARDSLAVRAFLDGHTPSFLKKFKAVRIEAPDSLTGKMIRGRFFVAPDYFCIGTSRDWSRVPLTPMAAQRIADTLGCTLPTRKMVDAIWRMARVQLTPVPMYAYRDSTPTMWHHHLIIEGQRQGRRGLIAGIKKDVVQSNRLLEAGRSDRVAIYGWHYPNGRPIQPLYTGHINWYVDYSHGIRLVSKRVRVVLPGKVAPKWMDIAEVLQDERLRPLLSDEIR